MSFFRGLKNRSASSDKRAPVANQRRFQKHRRLRHRALLRGQRRIRIDRWHGAAPTGRRLLFSRCQGRPLLFRLRLRVLLIHGLRIAPGSFLQFPGIRPMDLLRPIKAAPILQRITGGKGEGGDESKGEHEFHGANRSRIIPRCQPADSVSLEYSLDGLVEKNGCPRNCPGYCPRPSL